MKLNISLDDRGIYGKIDFNFILVILALNLIGLINLYSATHGVDLTFASKFWKQIIWLSGGWAFFVLCTFIDYNFFRRYAYVIYALNLICLVMVMFWGKSFYGAQRWLDLGFFRFQPSETIKLALILVLARTFCEYRGEKGLGLRDLWLPIALTLLPFTLVVRQPDLGTALLLLAIICSMVIFIKVRTSLLVSALLIGMVALPLTWKYGLKNYQKKPCLDICLPRA